MIQGMLFNLTRQSRQIGCLCYHTTYPAFAGQFWRKRNGMPGNPNAYGPLTDLPDYTFLDGRRTPAGSGKLKRAKEQNELADKIIKLTKEVDFAVDRRKQLDRDEEARREQIIASKLKPKGDQTSNNSQ